MWSRALKFVFVAATLVFLLNFLTHVGRETQLETQTYERKLEALEDTLVRDDITNLEAAYSSDVAHALKDMTSLHTSLKSLQSKALDIAQFLNSTVFAARHDIELDIRASGASGKEMQELQTKLDSCAKRMVMRSADLRDDLESLQLSVGFIVLDLAQHPDLVVTSSIEYLTQFKKEFDSGYKNHRSYIDMAMNQAHHIVILTLGTRQGRHADSVRAQIKKFSDQLREQRKDFDAEKQRYDSIKDHALKSLKSVIK